MNFWPLPHGHGSLRRIPASIAKRRASAPLAGNDRASILKAAGALADHLPVERVVLYGSKARGDDRPDSDIDLLILTARPLTVAEGFQVVDLLQPVQHRHHCIISPLPSSIRQAGQPEPLPR